MTYLGAAALLFLMSAGSRFPTYRALRLSRWLLPFAGLSVLGPLAAASWGWWWAEFLWVLALPLAGFAWRDPEGERPAILFTLRMPPDSEGPLPFAGFLIRTAPWKEIPVEVKGYWARRGDKSCIILMTHRGWEGPFHYEQQPEGELAIKMEDGSFLVKSEELLEKIAEQDRLQADRSKGASATASS